MNIVEQFDKARENLDKVREHFDNVLFEYWSLLPEPKPTYTEWYYGLGGVAEYLDVYDVQRRERYKVKVRFRNRSNSFT